MDYKRKVVSRDPTMCMTAACATIRFTDDKRCVAMRIWQAMFDASPCLSPDDDAADTVCRLTAENAALLAERDAARHTALTEAAATCRIMTAFFPDALVDGAETCASAIEHLRDTTPSPTGTPSPTDHQASEDR